MTDKYTYYSLFEAALREQDQRLANEFATIARERTPRQVFLWLENLRLSGQLPKELEQPLTDFWGLFC